MGVRIQGLYHSHRPVAHNPLYRHVSLHALLRSRIYRLPVSAADLFTVSLTNLALTPSTCYEVYSQCRTT